MPIRKYSEAIQDPRFASAPPEEQRRLNDLYWSEFEKENPSDRWGAAQADASRKAFAAKAEIPSASPISKRALEFQEEAARTQVAINNLDADGGWESPEQRSQLIQSKTAKLEEKRQQLDKTFSLFKPEVAKEMEPTWQTLDRFASDSGYFGGEGGLKDAANFAGDVATFGYFSEKAAEDKIKYENLRDTVSKDFNLAPEEVDDVMRHRLNKFDGEVSRDAFGTIHFKDSALVRNTDEIEDIVANSKLPDSVKAKAKDEVPQRVALFKEGVVNTAKQNFPELAKELGLGDDIDENYRRIVDATNKSRTAQAASGAGGYGLGRLAFVADLVPAVFTGGAEGDGGTFGVSTAEANPELQPELERLEKISQGTAALSDKIQQDKVRIFGTDAATVGQGAASVVESVALTAATGGAGNLIKAERIARAGAVGGAILKGVKAGLTVAPTAAIYGGEQALDTWERASQSEDPAIRARAGELAGKSFLAEFGVTTGMSMIGLGGVENVGAALASKATRQAFAKSASAAVLRAADNFALSPVSEAFEESLITALDSIHVQQQLNPDMTDEQVRKAIGDTIIATAFASGAVSGPKGVADVVGDIKNLSTQDKTTEQLHDASDAIYTDLATQENLPETETEGRAFPTSGPVSVAEIERERRVQIEQAEDPEERASLETSTPQELAEDWGVDLTEESQEPGAAVTEGVPGGTESAVAPAPEPSTAEAAVPTESLPEGQAPPAEEAGGVASVIPDEGNAPKAKEVVQKFLTPEAQALPPESFKQQKVASPEQVSLQNSVAKMYDALPEDDSKNPEVVKAYENLTSEVLDQHKAMLDSGLEIELVSENPYASSKEMIEDVKRGKLKVQRTDPQTFGSSPEVFTAGNHPMLKDSGLKDVNGQPMLVNDVFRGVHDYIAHAAFGSTFGALGEEAAWKAHLATIKDPLARRALTTETRGQNSWVNYRDEMLRDGKPIKKGEPGYVAPQDRPFATQKFALLPEEALRELGTSEETKPTQQPKAEEVATDKTEDKTDLLNAPIEQIAQAAYENPNAENAVLLAFAAVGIRPASIQAGERKMEQGELFQEGEKSPKGTYTPKALAAAQKASTTTLALIEGKADTTTGIHEAGHAIEDFLDEIGEGETKAALQKWAEDNGKTTWREQREYVARGFERFVINGVKTGVESVDRAFARIAEIMVNIYNGLKGSSVDIEIPPHIEKIFNDLLSRGAKLEAEGAAPVVVPVDVKKQAPKAQAKPIRKKTTRKVPAPEPFGVKREDLDNARKTYDIRKQLGMVVRMADEEAFDEAYAMMAKRDKGEDVLVGQQLVLNLMEDNRGTNKVEVALLAIHGFEIQKALKDLDNKIAKLDPGETQKRKAFETLQEALLNDFQDLVNVTQLQGSRAGLALQAMKLVANQVYSVDAMLRRRAIWKNTGNKGASKPLTAAEVRDTEKQSEKILKLIEERDRLMKDLEGKYTLKEAQAILEAAGKKLAKEKPVRRTALTERASVVATSARDRLRAMGLGVTKLNQMAGEKAVLPQFQRDSLETAKAMAAAGKISEEIRAVTGWFPGKYDGKMRWEIPDTGAKLTAGDHTFPFYTSDPIWRKTDRGEVYTMQGVSLENILNHPSLFEAYPFLKNVAVDLRYSKNLERRGEFLNRDPRNKGLPSITVTSPNKKQALSAVLHEIQHAIQKRERFATGSSVALNLSAAQYRKAVSLQNSRNKEDQKKGQEILDTAYAAYQRSAGEIEARDVQARASMTQEQLAATAPYSSENIAPENAIVLYQEEENTQVEILDAISDVGVEYLANGAKKLEAFTEKVVSEFGEEFRSQAQTIYNLSKDKLAKLASSARQKTPQELASLIDPTQDLSQKMVYNMALGFMRPPNNLKGDAVLDAVTKLLRNDYPDITREEVVVAFTGYGKILIPSQEQIKKDIRELRTVERLNAQLADLAKGELPKRTGLQRDKTTSPVRALMKQVEKAIRDSGLKHNDRKDRLAGSLDPIRTRLKNEIADMDQAIKTKTALNKAKKEPKTDAEIEKLKAQRDAMKKRYDATFGIDRKKISVEAQIKRASSMLDRQIKALEAEVRGEILNKTAKVKLDSPELKAKRERLEALREAKRAAEEALNPKKTSAEIATDRLRTSAQKSIERFEYFIANGTYPPKADGTPATMNDVMRDLLKTRDRLRDTVREIQKDRRILTPPEVIARNRAIRQLNKTIADLEARIAKRDFSKRAKKPESADPEVRNLKATVASLRETLDQIKRDTLKPISPEEKRIQRMIAASKKRKAKLEERIRNKDFSKMVKRDTKEDARLTQTKIDEAKAKAEWLEEGRKYAIANMTASQKFWHYVGGAFKLRKITTLGFELGIGMRQAYFYTLRAWANPIKVTTTFAKAFAGMFNRDKEIAFYNDVMDRPNSVYDKRMDLRFMSPFADLDRIQEADAIDPELMETINKKLPKWIPLRWVTELGLGVERFNRIVTNLTRAQMADTLIEKGIRDEGNPSKDELVVIGNAVMNATGRGSLKNPSLDSGLALANTVTISARWAVSRAKMNALEPIWTRRAGFDGTMKVRATVAADIYGKAVVGRALLGTVIVGIVRAITPDDEEEDIVWNPTSGKFGGISYKGTMIDLGGGMRPYINLLAQGIMGYKLNSKGEVVPLRGEGSIGFGKQDWRDSLYDFVRNRENINMAMILDTITQKHFGDIPMTKTSFTRQLLEPIIVEDLVNIFEAHGIRDGSVLATAMFFGVGVRTPWEKSEKEAEPEYQWIKFD